MIRYYICLSVALGAGLWVAPADASDVSIPQAKWQSGQRLLADATKTLAVPISLASTLPSPAALAASSAVNFAQVTQVGRNNSATVSQVGGGNVGIVAQQGSGNVAIVSQVNLKR